MSGQWLGHRDLCPSQNHGPCDCPCSDKACPGVDRCTDPGCQDLWPEPPLIRRVETVVRDL